MAIHTTKSASPEALAHARKLGAAAFARGAKRVPAWDRELNAMLGKDEPAIPLLDAWLRAWDEANIAAPVPGVTSCECCGSADLVSAGRNSVYCNECGDDCPDCQQRGRQEERGAA